MLTDLLSGLLRATPTYVDHTHVTWSFVAAGLGVLGLVKRLVLLAVVAVAVVVAGVVLGVISLHGTHCTPGSTHRVCVSER